MKREGARPKAAVVRDKALRGRHGEAGVVGNYFHGREPQPVRLCTFCNRRSFHVDRLPHAVLIGDSGTVLSKGLVNSREHLESLVTAHEMGVVSVQDYLKNSQSSHSKSKVA